MHERFMAYVGAGIVPALLWLAVYDLYWRINQKSGKKLGKHTGKVFLVNWALCTLLGFIWGQNIIDNLMGSGGLIALLC